MNERIRKLANKAGFKMLTDGRIIPTLDHNGECGRDLQKFAELIVRECLLKIGGAKIRNESYAELIERIKEDFGVEE